MTGTEGRRGIAGYLKSDALLVQSSINICLRIFLVCAILFNIALFLWSNSINIATVRAILDVRKKEDDLGEVFAFNLSGTVKDMWTAETYALSILLAFFSGAWPYVKLASMFVAFILPTSFLSFKARDSILVWLDVLGKWSLLDTFFMVMMMVAFQFDLIIAKDVEVNVYVKAEWGFYAFLLATMLSLILGHIVLYLHLLVADEESSTPSTAVTDGGNSLEGEAFMNHTFYANIMIPNAKKSNSMSTNTNENPLLTNDAESNWRTRKITITKFGKSIVILLILSCILSVIFGTCRNTFNFEFKGLTGFLLGDDAIQTYSAISIGTSLPAASRIPSDVGIRWLQASYFVIGFAMPVLFLVCMLGLWVVPLSLHRAKMALMVAEVINAWSALDVFVIALVACLLEIQQFAAFIVGDSCDELNKILEEYFDGILDGDDKCFDVITTLKTDAWLLYFSAVFLAVAGVIVMATCRVAYTQRLEMCLNGIRSSCCPSEAAENLGKLRNGKNSLANTLSFGESLVVGNNDMQTTPREQLGDINGEGGRVSFSRRFLSKTLKLLWNFKLLHISEIHVSS